MVSSKTQFEGRWCCTDCRAKHQQRRVASQPCDWRYPGDDGLVRVVKVKAKNKEYWRPVHRLCPLEYVEDSAEEWESLNVRVWYRNCGWSWKWQSLMFCYLELWLKHWLEKMIWTLIVIEKQSMTVVMLPRRLKIFRHVISQRMHQLHSGGGC